jgi:hypothetical protein
VFGIGPLVLRENEQMSLHEEYMSIFDELGHLRAVYYKFFNLFKIRDMSASRQGLYFSQTPLFVFEKTDLETWRHYIKDQKKLAKDTSDWSFDATEAQRRMWFFVQKLHEVEDHINMNGLKHIIYWMDIALEQTKSKDRAET